MVLVVYTRNNEGVLSWKYLDYFSKEKQDFYFVRAVWHNALQQELKDYTDIFVWSDGGPQHFKIAKTLYFFSTLEDMYKKKITYNFFASNHGHSMCDSHTGVGKQKLSREEKDNNEQIVGLDDVADSYSELKKTTVHKLESIDKKELVIEKKTSFTKGIKKFHQFNFAGTGRVYCLEQSGVGFGQLQIISEDVSMDIS